MKKILSLVALVMCAFACMDKVEYIEEDSSSVSGSAGSAVTGADAVAYVINQNILALHSIITAGNNKEFIASVKEYTDNYGSGYQFILTTEDTVVLYGSPAVAMAEETAAPMIEAEKDAESGISYWTLEGTRLKDALGKDIPVSNPYISIKPIGMNWCYSVDGGVEWTVISPIGALTNPYTLEVTPRGAIHLGNMQFTPSWQPLFYYTMEEETSVASGFAVRVEYIIDASETPNPSIAVTNNGGWTVTAKQPIDGKGSLIITAPEGTSKGTSVTVTFTDGNYQVAQNIDVLIKSPNAWEAIVQSGAEYSKFRDMVAVHNIIDEEGFVTGNTYLDMYNADGAGTWNMRQEEGGATLLLPSNAVIEATLAEAAETLKNTLGREPNERDLKKFNDWILRACFFNQELTAAELKGTVDLNAIEGFTSEGKSVEAALWRPAAQGITGESKKLVNGNAFYLSKLHIPNYIIIYRIKSRPADSYYKDAATVQANTICYGGEIYCRQDNGQKATFRTGGWTMSDGMVWPEFTMQIFNIKPTQAALDNDDPIGFEMNTFILNDKDEVCLVKLPAGEYVFSYGCASKSKGQHHVISYAAGNGEYTELATIAQADYPLDRTSNGWPEYFRDYDAETSKLDGSYLKLDCDGKVVGNITITGNGFQQFRLKNLSYDLSTLETAPDNYCESANATLHWCLRPTTSVY